MLRACACVFALGAATNVTAQSYPDKPIRIVCPAAPGGISDLLSRIVAQRLTPLYGQPVIVDNRAGSGGHLAGDLVAKSAPDGYTLMQATIAHNAAYAMYSNLTYDPAKDLQPVVLLGESQGVLVVHPSLPAKSVKEFIALAKARPGELNYGSAGAGTAIHMAAELFKWVAQVDLTHIAYKGSAPAMIELMGGQVDLHVDQVMSAISYVRSGKVRALAVTSRAKRSPQLPDTPTFDEAGVSGFEASGFTGLVAPAGTPPEVISKLNAAIHRVLAQPAIRDFMTGLGSDVVPGTPEELGNYIRSDLARWTGVVKKSGIKLDP